MTTDIHKHIDQNPELRDAMLDIAEEILPHILEALLLEERIDENRINDLKYVWSVVMENRDVIETLYGNIRIDDQIMESAKDAVQLGRIEVVVILVATTIEHRLNQFYRDVLEIRLGLSSEEATEAIKSNIHTKLGWLLQVTTNNEISEELLKRVKQIIDLRNAFVHYKYISVPINDVFKPGVQPLIQQVHNIGLDTILKTPDELENELETINQALFPEYARAGKLAEAMKMNRPSVPKNNP